MLPFPAASLGMWEPARFLRGSQGSLADQAVPLPLLPPRGTSWCLWPPLALLCCPRSRLLLLLLTDQDPSAPAEGQGDLGWLRPFWGLQGFPRQGKGSRHSSIPPAPASPHRGCAESGGMQEEGRAARDCGCLAACQLNQKGSQQGDPGDKVTSEPSIRWLRAAPSPAGAPSSRSAQPSL